MKRDRHPKPPRRDRDRREVPARRLPPKIAGQHRWTAVVTYSVTNGEAAAHAAGGALVLGDRNVFFLEVRCFDCDVPYDDASAMSVCELERVEESA